MSLKIYTIAFIALLILAGCNPEAPFQSPTTAVEEIPKDLVVVLERSVCFGICPDYKLTITADGTTTFEGRHFVKKKGVTRSSLSQEKVKQIVAEFERAKYFNLKNSYVNEPDGCAEVWTDYPTVKTSITIKGKSKSIDHYHGCQGPLIPQALTDLENKIDKVANTSQWLDKSNQ